MQLHPHRHWDTVGEMFQQQLFCWVVLFCCVSAAADFRKSKVNWVNIQKRKPNGGWPVRFSHWLGLTHAIISHWLLFQRGAWLLGYIMSRTQLSRRSVWACSVPRRREERKKKKTLWAEILTSFISKVSLIPFQTICFEILCMYNLNNELLTVGMCSGFINIFQVCKLLNV